MAPGTKPALVGAGLTLAMALGLGLIRATHGSTGESHVEGRLPTLAIMAAVAAPGVLALVGVATRRPVLWGAAGITCAPLVVVSIAAFPLVIPCVLLTVAFVRGHNGQRLSTPEKLILVGFPVPIAVGLWILVTRTGQFTYRFPGGSESGEYFTPAHARLAIALTVVDVAVACVVAQLHPAKHGRPPEVVA